jgi:hypothetical protein
MIRYSRGYCTLLGQNRGVAYSRNYSSMVKLTNSIRRDIYVLRNCINSIDCICWIDGIVLIDYIV